MPNRGYLVRSINIPDPDMSFYVYSLVDVPGVVAANNFLAIFNPVGSGRIHVGFGLNISSYATGNTSTVGSMTATRITAASAGTLVAASTIGRFFTPALDPVSKIYNSNPTVTKVGLPLLGVAPVVSTGTGASPVTTMAAAGSAPFIFQPGEGYVLSTAVGATSQVWNIQALFAEYAL